MDAARGGPTRGRTIVPVLFAALLFLGPSAAWAAEPSSAETANASSCSTCCKDSTANLAPGPAEGAEGNVPCTTPSGPLEVSDGFGAVALHFEGASYVSATFDRSYPGMPATAAVGAWHFTRPSLSFASDVYSARHSATRFRTYSAQGGVWVGKNENRLSILKRNLTGYPGKAVIFDREGSAFVFSDPYFTGGPNYLERVELLGGARFEFLPDPGEASKTFEVWLFDPENQIYTRLWRYTWGQYGPTTISEYVATTDVGQKTYDSDQWALRKTTTFRYGASNYANCHGGDLVAIDVNVALTILNNFSRRRTVFKYWTGSYPHQLRAVIGPDSYRDFLLTETAATETTVFTAELSALRGDAGGYSKNYLDEEFEYFSPNDSNRRLRLWKRTIAGAAGSCGCAGASAGAFFYDYVSNLEADLGPNERRVTVSVRRDSENDPMAYYDYNDYGQRLVEVLTGTVPQIRAWQYHEGSWALQAALAPSACASYDTTTHVLETRATVGYVKWYAYGPTSTAAEYLSSVSWSQGTANTPTPLSGFAYTKLTLPSDDRFRYFMDSQTSYVPDNAMSTGQVPAPTSFTRSAHPSDALLTRKLKTTLPVIVTAHNGSNGVWQLGGNQIVGFRYNGLDMKIAKHVDESIQRVYYYGVDWRLLEESTWNGSAPSAVYQYVWGNQYIDELIARRTHSSGQWEYVLQDANFNVITRFNSSGYPIARYTYTAYGQPTQLNSGWTTQSDITEDLFLFSGRQYHYINGIYDYRHRFYHPYLGRFLERDPIGIWGDGYSAGNGYSYAGSAPYGLLDPYGESVTACNECDDKAKCTCTLYFRLCIRVADAPDAVKDKGKQLTNKQLDAAVAKGQLACKAWQEAIKSWNVTRKKKKECQLSLDCKVVPAKPKDASSCAEQEKPETVKCRGDDLVITWDTADLKAGLGDPTSFVQGRSRGVFDTNDTKVVMQHEFGHFFGLADDYKWEVPQFQGKPIRGARPKKVWAETLKEYGRTNGDWHLGIMANSKTGTIGAPEINALFDKNCKSK